MTDSPDTLSSIEYAVPEPSKIIKRLGTNHRKLKSAKDKMNLHGVSKAIRDLRQHYEQIEQTWRRYIEQQETDVTALQNKISEPEYRVSLESALRKIGIPFSGAFPNYDIPPFRLSIDIDGCLAKLSMGRKREQSRNLAPHLVAEWVSKKYESLINSKFSFEQLCKELTIAYKYISGEKWGNPVLVKDIYRLLTIKPEAREVYPETRYIFDLSQLLDQYDIKYRDEKDENIEYVFEFTPHKQSTKNYTVVNRHGIQKTVGNITIRKVEN